MLLAGDEIGRTQQGNNNAYCQDNEVSWVDWDIDEAGKSLLRFVRRLTSLRHQYPILRRNRFLNGEYVEELGVKDVTWINITGAEVQHADWSDVPVQCFGMLLDGRAQTTGIRQRGKEATLLLIVNGHREPVSFTLPKCNGAGRWSVLIDTNDTGDEGNRQFDVGAGVSIAERSLAVLLLEGGTSAAPTSRNGVWG